MFFMAWAWPAFIAPLFNSFSPLQDPVSCSERIEALLGRCGFASKGVFVVDNSRRSSHGNAYFTGIGRHKRIVFFDTLLERLAHPEVEAVLAHELGHFRLKHVRKRLLLSIGDDPRRARAAWLAERPGRLLQRPRRAGALHPCRAAAVHAGDPRFHVLHHPARVALVAPSRVRGRRLRHRHASAGDLASALVKLHRDNASTLTPDPVYAAFYYSHPPPLARIARLRAAVQAG